MLIGTGGDSGRVLKIDKPDGKPHELFKAEGVQYIWKLVRTDDGNLYAATGPQGQLFEINPDGSSRVLLDSGENNLLSMISDGKDMLYVGTDPHGLVYRVNRKTGESFVLYNAAEAEISALALDKKGNLYAATAEAREETPPGMPGAETEGKTGRPEGGAIGVPIPPAAPKPPAPPAPPDPNPGRPDPIPKEPQKDQILLPLPAGQHRHRLNFAKNVQHVHDDPLGGATVILAADHTAAAAAEAPEKAAAAPAHAEPWQTAAAPGSFAHTGPGNGAFRAERAGPSAIRERGGNR